MQIRRPEEDTTTLASVRQILLLNPRLLFFTQSGSSKPQQSSELVLLSAGVTGACELTRHAAADGHALVGMLAQRRP